MLSKKNAILLKYLLLTFEIYLFLGIQQRFEEEDKLVKHDERQLRKKFLNYCKRYVPSKLIY